MKKFNHLEKFESFKPLKEKLKTAHVKFKNPKYNYSTSVNGNLSDEEIRKYFIGKEFNLAPYKDKGMVDNLQKCIDVEIEDKKD